jgi:hypothetical protein
MIEALSLGQFRLKNPATMAVGTGGVTSTFLLNNIDTIVGPAAAAAPGSALYFQVLVMWGVCVNDFANNVSATTSLANLKSMFAWCKARGKILMLGSPYAPRSQASGPTTTAQAQTAAIVNNMTCAWARGQPGIIYVDFWNDVVDTTRTNGAAASTIIEDDGLHLASLGVEIVAQRALAQAGSQFAVGPVGILPQWDIFDPIYNPGGNLLSLVAAPQAISSGIYNNGTGVVTLTLLGIASNMQAGSIINVFNLAGTGAVASLNGTFIATSVSGTAVTYNAGANLGASTITSGNIVPPAAANMFQGTGGTINAGCAGQMPNGYAIARNSGTDTIVVTKVAATNKFGATGSDSVAIGTSTAGATCQSAFQGSTGTLSAAAQSLLIGSQIEFLILFSTPATVSGISDIYVTMQSNFSGYGPVWGVRVDSLAQANWLANTTYLIRTPPWTVPVGTTSLNFQINNTFLTGNNASVSYARPCMRMLLQ